MAKERVRLKSDDLKTQQLVEIEVFEGPYKGHYPSRVEGVGKDTLILAMPIRKRQIVPLRVGDLINVSFTREEGGVLFQTRILRRAQAPLPIILVEKRDEGIRLQRRAWVRVEIILPIRFRLQETQPKPDNEAETEEKPYIKAETLDLSGGGLLFTSNEKMELGDVLDLYIGIPELNLLKLEAKICRVLLAPPTAKNRYMIGVEFLNIQNAIQERIVRVVFERQRELLKRGVLG